MLLSNIWSIIRVIELDLDVFYLNSFHFCHLKEGAITKKNQIFYFPYHCFTDQSFHLRQYDDTFLCTILFLFVLYRYFFSKTKWNRFERS